VRQIAPVCVAGPHADSVEPATQQEGTRRRVEPGRARNSCRAG
jgi:hypothetical protein